MDLFKWGRGEGQKARFEQAEQPVGQTMIWMCEKCGSKLSSDEHNNPTRLVQKALKSIISEHKDKRNMRAMVSTCMNMCPKEKIAASIVNLKSGQTRFIAFEVTEPVEQIALNLYKELQ
ncbi:MAG: hypothetical protein H7249_03375 [Chitinophagaceae bacterium]|nr:hypothetical protein [Oligoflexus sp.]